MMAVPVVNLEIKAFQAAARRATVAAFRQAAKVVAQRAREIAPVAEVHRTDRTYPPRRHYAGEARIKDSIIHRARDETRKGRGVYGMVRVKVGYSTFVEYGTKFMRSPKGAFSFTRKALAERMGQVMSILQKEWPK